MIKTMPVLCITFVLTLLCFNLVGQNSATNTLSLGMPEVSLLRAASSATINLTLSPQVAGRSVSESITNSNTKLLFSSVIGAADRTLKAQVTTGAIPAGTVLKLLALAPIGNQVGDVGDISAEITLTSGGGSVAQNIITGIGSCYSGVDAGDGWGIQYTYALETTTENYANIRATEGAQVVVTLTLTAVN